MLMDWQSEQNTAFDPSRGPSSQLSILNPFEVSKKYLDLLKN